MAAISLQPKYIALIQKPTCCAVTCLQMILYRNEFGLYDQEELAIKFGVKISEKDASAFSVSMPRMTNVNFDEGIQTIESENHINKFFKEHALPLKAKSYKQSAISSLPNFLITNIKANHDIWVEYHAQEIHAGDKDKGDYIHDGLIESFDDSNGVAIIMDSVPEHRQRIQFSLPQLEKSISKHYGRETGFIVIEKS